MKNLLFVLVTVFGLTACGGGGGGSSSGGGTGGSGGNRAPSASFTVACADLDCTFTNNSTDSDGTIASSSWNFGDGATATTTDANHTFGSYGSYTVSLTVTDNDGATGSTSRSVTVAVDVHAQVVSIDMFDESIVFKQDFDHRVDSVISDPTPIVEEDFECSGCSFNFDLNELAIENGELKVTFKEGQIGTRFGFQKPLGQHYNEMYLTFQVRFDANYDQESKGGKLMGLSGRPVGGDNPVSGCVAVGEDEGFSARFQYRQKGQLAHYVYHQDKVDTCGDQRYIEDPSESDNAFMFRKEQTYTLEMRVKMNEVGQANGVMETYINGVKMRTDDEFVLSKSGTYGIDTFTFGMYIGGNTSEWELANPSTLYLDNFVLSTERVVD